ncbi:Kelch-type beta propeller, partial [Cynara cardunculus var. scolymus]
ISTASTVRQYLGYVKFSSAKRDIRTRQSSLISRKANMATDSRNWHSLLDSDQWVALPVAGRRPSARYKAFDLKSLSWSTIKLSTKLEAENDKDSTLLENFPAISGHSMVKWGNTLLFLGGHSKDTYDNVTVRFFDLESHMWGVMEATGKVPVARGGQSVSLVGSKLIMFGGEDKHRRLMNDVHVLDLTTMTWNVAETIQTPPAPRFDHTAAVHADRYLQIFGGCSHSIFFNDLHVLDLETLEWSQPQIQGDVVSPRAGHAGVSIDEKWFMVGGGDNRSGASETLVMDMPKLAISVLTNVKGRDPLASEGLSVSAALIDDEQFLVAFGGYNGKYNNEVFVMRPKPKDSKQPKIFQSPAAAAAAASVTAAYALAKSESLDFSTIEHSKPKVDLSVEVGVLKGEKKMLESSIAEVKTENSALMEKLVECNGTRVDLTKELHSVQGQLASEKSRCADLEAQILELQKMLSSMQSIEQEVQTLRSQKSAIEQDMELAATDQRQGSGGVWSYDAVSNAEDCNFLLSCWISFKVKFA